MSLSECSCATPVPPHKRERRSPSVEVMATTRVDDSTIGVSQRRKWRCQCNHFKRATGMSPELPSLGQGARIRAHAHTRVRRA